MTTSGPTTPTSFSSPDDGDLGSLVERIRRAAAIGSDEGPNDERIRAAVRGFEEQFDYWYTRVMREAAPKYRQLVIRRINPLVRRVELDGLDSARVATRLVGDYRNRNFVTAGGWALERMAVAMCVDGQKSPARGIDIQRYDPARDSYHLYVLKSGTVTRNSDIVQALKRHSRDAEQLLKQGGANSTVTANYAIAAGKTSSGFVDGIRRPSSAEFWAEMTGLDEDRALDLILAIAAEAGRRANIDASTHVRAMELLVADYISVRGRAEQVDWEFITDVTMKVKSAWRAEDAERHRRAWEQLHMSGYVPEGS